ncbi:DegT/DnrJ/EryC1/StrS family aminotransferase [Brevibacillus daliensis]|uniref:DegT/DnrJ/EryC1/StrS family aminotransferase n=1 Tax=Brevibacillus daliensis TaxID=2892995 RepID=UPI001E61943B|nr:DegT/DnrJ/EryC1/StrS aminotransferase family protein [Brevibacillus daliensis]
MKIPFYIPYLNEEEIVEVTAAIQSNWLSKGPKTLEFEKEFAKKVGSQYAVGLNSCTAGLHLAQLALGIGQGDEVITTPYTFVATSNTILHCGAKPVFVDIDPLTLNICAEAIEQAITPRTKAIIPVHFAGYPCDMDQIREISKRYNLAIIEDAAHAVYTKYKDEPIGSIGDITCFSFYATKNLTTGEGGMITTNDEAIANQIRIMSLHGMSRNAWNRYAAKGAWYYEVEQAGFKYNMTDIQAAMGLIQLQKLEEMQTLRKQLAQAYNEALRETDELILPYDSPEHCHSWHLYYIQLKEDQVTITRNELIEKLNEAGIGTSVHFIPVPHHPFYQKQGYRLTDYPVAKKTYESIISLPFYPTMTKEAVMYVAETLKTILSLHKR